MTEHCDTRFYILDRMLQNQSRIFGVPYLHNVSISLPGGHMQCSSPIRILQIKINVPYNLDLTKNNAQVNYPIISVHETNVVEPEPKPKP